MIPHFLARPWFSRVVFALAIAGAHARPAHAEPETSTDSAAAIDPLVATTPAAAEPTPPPAADVPAVPAQPVAPAPIDTAPAATTPRPSKADMRQRVAEILDGDNEIADRDRQGRNMVIGGSVMVGLAFVLAVAACTVAVKANIVDVVDPDNRGHRTAIGLGVASAIFVIPGAIVMPIGFVRQHDARREARQKARTGATLGLRPGGLQIGF
jgi:hypothetical protein